jgi:type II secretory pathway pseudopilin PulG
MFLQQASERLRAGGCPGRCIPGFLPSDARCGSTLNSVRAKQRERASAFTLLELLIVVGIIAVLLVLLAPALTSIKSATDATSAAYTIKGVLEQARTYAKANHTYVFVGFAEVDSSVDPSAIQQVPGNGRVVIAVVASNDGTRQVPYTSSNPSGDWAASYSNGTHLVAIGKLQRYENLHFFGLNFGSWAPTDHPNSSMARYQPSNNTYNLGTSGSVTPISWPLGSPLANGQYNFTVVVNFDPQGVARIATQTNADEIARVMEIDFLTTHGTLVSPTPMPFNQDIGNHIVIQIAPVSGAIRLYRP